MQNIEFERLYANSGAKTRSQFILSAIFGRPLKVVKIDKAATDFYIRLTNLQSDYRRVGVNYNQVAEGRPQRGADRKESPGPALQAGTADRGVIR